MRYNFNPGECKTAKGYSGTDYVCKHPLYSACTLYSDGIKGLAVIQQRYNRRLRHSYYGPIDCWLIDEIYCNPKFRDIFQQYATPPTDGLYPTVTVRQLMWRLRMKPMKRQFWETNFDRFIL